MWKSQKQIEQLKDEEIKELRKSLDSRYSKEEVIAFVKWMYDYKADINKVEELFEEFKKK
jgi:hypothetical protein